MSDIQTQRRIDRLEQEIMRLRSQLAGIPLHPARGGGGTVRLGDDIQDVGTANASGSGILAAREDHVHANNLPYTAESKAALPTRGVTSGSPGYADGRGYTYTGAAWICTTHLEEA